MRAAAASLVIVATLAVCCWGQENTQADTAELSRAELEATVREARQAAREAREAARAAHLALEQSQAAATAAQRESPQDRLWHKALRSSEHRQARIEAQRWRGTSAARPTVYVNYLYFPGIPSRNAHAWITQTYSWYPPSVVVPVHRTRSYYSWYRY